MTHTIRTTRLTRRLNMDKIFFIWWYCFIYIERDFRNLRNPLFKQILDIHISCNFSNQSQYKVSKSVIYSCFLTPSLMTYKQLSMRQLGILATFMLQFCFGPTRHFTMLQRYFSKVACVEATLLITNCITASSLLKALISLSGHSNHQYRLIVWYEIIINMALPGEDFILRDIYERTRPAITRTVTSKAEERSINQPDS